MDHTRRARHNLVTYVSVYTLSREFGVFYDHNVQGDRESTDASDYLRLCTIGKSGGIWQIDIRYCTGCRLQMHTQPAQSRAIWSRAVFIFCSGVDVGFSVFYENTHASYARALAQAALSFSSQPRRHHVSFEYARSRLHSSISCGAASTHITVIIVRHRMPLWIYRDHIQPHVGINSRNRRPHVQWTPHRRVRKPKISKSRCPAFDPSHLSRWIRFCQTSAKYQKKGTAYIRI